MFEPGLNLQDIEGRIVYKYCLYDAICQQKFTIKVAP
jgi:hypothetical protein